MNQAHQLALAARRAQRTLAAAPAAQRTRVLETLAELLLDKRDLIAEANSRDLNLAQTDGLENALIQRLALGERKLRGLVEGIRQLAETPDPVDRILSKTELDSGLILSKVQSPLGVLLIIFESRPDAVIQICGLTLRSANAAILKGGREARGTNAILIDCLREALERWDLDPNVVIGVEERSDVDALLQEHSLIDLVIPRGSGQLVQSIMDRTKIPVLGHAEGVCHLYLHADADPSMAQRLIIDGKCDYPAACNATEALLVHHDFLPELRAIGNALMSAGVELHTDEICARHLDGGVPATDADWGCEFGDLRLAVRAVPDLDSALGHIAHYGSAHTDAICTEDPEVAERFLREVDSASVFHNASTRFADGQRYGLGAEVGIATGRIHARGPVGIDGLMTTRWILRGEGQIAGDYGPGKRSFTHRAMPPTQD